MVQVTCVSINSNIVFKILWIHFVCVSLMLKQIHIFFFTAPCLLIKDAPCWEQLINDIYCSNDKYSNVKYKVSLDISASTLILTATMKYIISRNRFQKSLFLLFCNFLLYFHLFQLFSRILMSFFETIHSYSFSF